MFHGYVEAYLHKVISIFNNEQDLMSTAFIIPIIIASLCVIPAFFIARRIAGNFGGVIAGVFVAIHPAFLTRTVGGFSDTDAYNVLFPLVVCWLFLEAFETKSMKKGIVLSSLSGLFIGLYSLTWGGWWYIFNFLLTSLVLYLAIFLIMHRDNLKKIIKQASFKHTISILISLFVFSMLFVTAMSGYYVFTNAFSGPMSFIRLKEVGIRTVWPNVFTTVAEQNPASLNNVINQIGTGSLLLFILSIVGITLTLIRKKNRDNQDLIYFILSSIWIIIIMSIKPQNLILFISLIFLPIIIKIIWALWEKNVDIDFRPAIILLIWFASTTYASTKGIRFLLLLVPVYSLGLGICFGLGYKYISKIISEGLHLNKTLAKTVVMVLLIFLVLNPFNSAKATARQEIPSMNDAWYESLDKINRYYFKLFLLLFKSFV
jgi:dolichyl-diphosphooligosaccharide--protein glycosyltransferase